MGFYCLMVLEAHSPKSSRATTLPLKSIGETPLSASILAEPSSLGCLSLLIRTPVTLDLGSTPLQCDLILTDYLCNNPISNYGYILGYLLEVRASIYLWGRGRDTTQPTTEPFRLVARPLLTPGLPLGCCPRGETWRQQAQASRPTDSVQRGIPSLQLI